VVDPQKPCVRCGAVNRDTRGRCRPCQQKYQQSKEARNAKKVYDRRYRKSEKGREAIKAYDRGYRQSEKGREAKKAYDRKYCYNLTKPCKKCGVVDRYKNGKCKACSTIYQKLHQRSAQYREWQNKHKKLNFQFRLQNQQKVIEQCQQQLTQQNEIS
jgi:predicted ATP-dependent serine protease